MAPRNTNVRLASRLFGHFRGESILSRVRNTFQAFLRTSETPERLISLEERLVIGPKKTLMLVNCAGRRFLFATAGDSITPFVEVRPRLEMDLAATIPVIGYLGEQR
jgi:hypothetical protein